MNKDKDFYVKLISSKNKKPITYFRQRLKSEPQIGNGILSLVGTLAPLIASLFSRRWLTAHSISHQRMWHKWEREYIYTYCIGTACASARHNMWYPVHKDTSCAWAKMQLVPMCRESHNLCMWSPIYYLKCCQCWTSNQFDNERGGECS